MIWVLFSVFIAVLALVGGFTAYRGISRGWAQGAGTVKKSIGVAEVCFGIVLLASGAFLVDRCTTYRPRKEIETCRSRLSNLYSNIMDYKRGWHRMPGSLEELIDEGYAEKGDLICTSGSGGADESAPDSSYGYTFRHVKDPENDDIIAYDSVPHVVPHLIFRLGRKPGRNVLFADGNVEFLTEKRFRKLLEEQETGSSKK